MWLAKNWKLIAGVLIVLGVLGYGAYKKHQGISLATDKAALENLQHEQQVQQEDMDTRRRQDDALLRDITPLALDGILQKRAF